MGGSGWRDREMEGGKDRGMDRDREGWREDGERGWMEGGEYKPFTTLPLKHHPPDSPKTAAHNTPVQYPNPLPPPLPQWLKDLRTDEAGFRVRSFPFS